MSIEYRIQKLSIVFGFCIGVLISCPGCNYVYGQNAPVARIIPKADTLFGDIRLDNYYWIKNKSDSAVIDYIKAENSYTQAKAERLKGLEDRLYDEMVGRLKETDTSAAQKIDDYYYYNRIKKGQQYPVYCRKKENLSGKEEIMLNLNQLAKNQKYLNLGAIKISPDHRFLAFALDTLGSESYAIRIKDLQADTLFLDLVGNAGPEVEWANDNRTIFYETLDKTQRPYRLYRHLAGTPTSSDSLIYQEDDEAYFLSISKTKSRQYLLLSLESNTTNETRYLDANNPTGDFAVLYPRQHEIKYYIDHQGDQFFVMTNEKAKNYKVMEVSIKNPAKSTWHEFIPTSDSVKIDGIDAFKNNLVVYERSGGLQKIRIIELANYKESYVNFPDPGYAIYQAPNPVYDTPFLRFRYSSMVSPLAVYDYDMTQGKLELIKRNEVKGYNQDNYKMERIFARATDTIPVPIVLVYRKDLFKGNGTNPMFLEGYGAYGIPSDAEFSSSRISLLDRGFVYAISQIRGGGEMGRWWYDDGKLFHKRNTFTDFIASAEYLINKKYTSKDKLAIIGGSAGGLLIGAVVNMRPDLFKVVVADVPFVDMLNTMLDPTIPLTVTEYEEWGNPHDSLSYFYMRSYSPYDNVERKAYPAMLVTGGLNDPRVGYWEPTKWVAKLRSMKTDSNILLLKINMGEGHFGVSGRYAELKDVAFQFAFCLDQLGIDK